MARHGNSTAVNESEEAGKPLFSIVMPVYNSENTLCETLKSIREQAFSNFEVIFADGASTDGTLGLISDFRQANAGIAVKVISQPDSGIYEAMNRGLGIAEGEWVYFMGSDDRFYNISVLSLVAAETASTDADLIYGNVHGKRSGKCYVYDTPEKVLSTGIHHQSVFYRRMLFSELGGYDLRFRIAADYHFTLKVFLNRKYVKRYINADIALYGEDGYSSQHFDYKYFSGHYRFLAASGWAALLPDREKCLQESVYCCLYLAKEKRSLRTAWSNLLYYVFIDTGLQPPANIRTLLRMIRWTLSFAR